MAIAPDTSVNGTADANQVDYFKLPLKAGQRVILDCLAQRIDSRLDGTLVVYSPVGKELVRNRDAIGNDPLIDFTAPADGEYRIGLFDFTYRGGADYFYRLTAHLGPQLDFIFPPSGLPGSTDDYLVYGRNLPGGQPADGVTLNGDPLQKLEVQIPLPADEQVRRSLEVGGYVTSASALVGASPSP